MRSKFIKLAILLLWMAGGASAWADSDSSSSEIYRKHCSVCHGLHGAGDSSAARGMSPPPRDFTTPDALVMLNRDRMIKSVTEGRPATAMPAWRDNLTPEQISGVVNYIRDSLMISSAASDASPGRRLFAENCSVCHGDKGNTAAWARGGLIPSPRDFTSELARQELTLQRLIFSITYGRQETAMPPWGGRLKQEEIEAVAEYITYAFLFPVGRQPKESAHHDGGEASGHDHAPAHAGSRSNESEEHEHDHYDIADMNMPLPQGLIGDIEWGKRFYKDNCVACHGEKGDGQGPRAYFIFPKPRNFLHPASQHKYNRPHLFHVISEGEEKTEMPAWNKVLNPQEIANIAEYLFQTFIAPGLPEITKGSGTTHNHGPATTVSHDHEPPNPPPPIPLPKEDHGKDAAPNPHLHHH